MPPKIAIIGAGPAGLTFARLLQKNELPCTIYEAEKDSTVRNQGGTLDLHPEDGQAALKEAGLFEEFQRRCRPEGQALKLMNYKGEIIMDENMTEHSRTADMDDRPEIDRNDLRSILLDSVEPSRIKWGHKVSKIETEPQSPGKHTIHFSNGTKVADVDLVVGADGAWSKARPLVTDVRPMYSGVTAAELWASNVSTQHPWLSEHVGQGSNFMFDEGRSVMCQRNAYDKIRVYACVRQPEDWMDSLDWTDTAAVRKLLVEKYFSNCGEDITRSIIEPQDECVPRKLWMLPVGHHWGHRAGLTLLGDAAHLMTPFAGVGVNLALTDSMKLANELVSRKDSLFGQDFSPVLDSAVQAYEREMFVRSKAYAEKSLHGLHEHFAKDGGRQMYDRITAK